MSLSDLSDADLLAAYKAAKPAPVESTRTPAEFAKTYGSAAERAGKALGVDPQTLIGQWGLETGWGKSVIPGTNNLGNIKDFAGGGVAATDNMTGSRDKYRSYASPDAFADDFVSLVQRKYPDAVGAKDATSFAKALKAGGYAEDPRYVDKVTQAARMAGSTPNPVMATVGRAVESIIPSAEAAPKSALEGMSDADLLAAYQKLKKPAAAPQAAPEQPGVGSRIAQAVGGALAGPGQMIADAVTGGNFSRDLLAGGVRGMGSVGATLLRPFESGSENTQRRQSMDDALQNLVGANPSSMAYKGGQLGGELAGTAGAGGVVGNALRLGAQAPVVGNALGRLATATSSGGMSVGEGGSTLANLATRAAGGGIAGGAQVGMINPEDAALGAGIGAALPVVGAAAGSVGRGLGRATAPAVDGNMTAVNAARDAGYVIPPSQGGGGFMSRTLEGMGGKIKTAQNASVRNQEVTNSLVRRDLGIAADTPITPETIGQVRATANNAYTELGQAGQINTTDKFRTAVSNAGQRSEAFAKDFPELVRKDVDSLVSSFADKKAFDAQSGIEAIKRLREGQRASLSPMRTAEEREMGRVQGRIAQALEDAMEDGLQASGKTDLLSNFRKARTILAKAYDVEKAVNPATGSINAQTLGRQLAKGRPLSGGIEQAAQFGQAFPKAAQTPEMIGGRPPWSPLDFAVGGLGAGAGSMLPLLAMAARPASRATALSPMVQNRLGQQGGNDALMQLLSQPDAQRLLYRSAPVLGAQ